MENVTFISKYSQSSSLSFLKSSNTDPETLEENGWLKQTQAITHKYYGKRVFLRGLIEFSNICRQNCTYCGLRKDNHHVKRYRMSEEEILYAIAKVHKDGIQSVVLQSGEDMFFSRSDLCHLVHSIKKKYPKLAITLSIGERDLETYKDLRKAGAERFLMKHETCNPRLYQNLHPNQSLIQRLHSQSLLFQSGYILGSGFLIGLPEQTDSDILKEIHFLSQMHYDMWGIGVFTAASHTPLCSYPSGSVPKTYKAMILSRISYGPTMIPVTTAFHSLAGESLTVLAIRDVANVFMINYTPSHIRGLYQIYDNKQSLTFEKTLTLIEKAGKIPDFSQGVPYYVNH